MSEDTTLLKKIAEDVQDIWKILSGNGEPGLCEDVRNNTKEIREIKEKPDRIGKWLIRAIGIIISIGMLWIAYQQYNLTKHVERGKINMKTEIKGD